jgi:hypothetical protein
MSTFTRIVCWWFFTVLCGAISCFAGIYTGKVLYPTSNMFWFWGVFAAGPAGAVAGLAGGFFVFRPSKKPPQN